MLYEVITTLMHHLLDEVQMRGLKALDEHIEAPGQSSVFLSYPLVEENPLLLTFITVITSYSIHYTKLYDSLGTITTDISTSAADTLDTAANATTAITNLETMLTDITSVRSQVGASINRLDYISDNLTNMQENTDSAIGNIMDADYAAETSEMSKQQLLEQAGISVLSAVSDAQSLIKNP